MTIWRPYQGIRFKALGLAWRHGKLLAAEVLDDAGAVKGVRPLGGTVEFGETAEAAVMREFDEELGINVTVQGAPFFFENIYKHEGAIGHEILAIFNVTTPRNAFSDDKRIAFHEDNGALCHANWYALEDLDTGEGPALFPRGLKPRIIAARNSRELGDL